MGRKGDKRKGWGERRRGSARKKETSEDRGQKGKVGKTGRERGRSNTKGRHGVL